MGMLFMAHSGVRYIVLLAGIIALALSLMKGQDANARKAMGAFVGAVDLQVLLGLLLEYFTRIGVGTLIAVVSGVAGMFLAVPITAILKISLSRIGPTKPLAELLAGRLPSLS